MFFCEFSWSSQNTWLSCSVFRWLYMEIAVRRQDTSSCRKQHPNNAAPALPSNINYFPSHFMRSMIARWSIDLAGRAWHMRCWCRLHSFMLTHLFCCMWDQCKKQMYDHKRIWSTSMSRTSRPSYQIDWSLRDHAAYEAWGMWLLVNVRTSETYFDVCLLYEEACYFRNSIPVWSHLDVEQDGWEWKDERMKSVSTSSTPCPSWKSDSLVCNHVASKAWGKIVDIGWKHRHDMLELLFVAQRAVMKEFN